MCWYWYTVRYHKSGKHTVSLLAYCTTKAYCMLPGVQYTARLDMGCLSRHTVCFTGEAYCILTRLTVYQHTKMMVSFAGVQ